MKKMLFSLGALLLLAVSSLTCNSCTNDDDSVLYFACGIQQYNVTGSEDRSEIDAYVTQVMEAYYRSLGMLDGYGELIVSGDYEQKSADMKSRFEHALLPDAPVTNNKYTVTIALFGSDKNNSNLTVADLDILATKTLTNL